MVNLGESELGVCVKDAHLNPSEHLEIPLGTVA